jgi:hypothetical protein
MFGIPEGPNFCGAQVNLSRRCEMNMPGFNAEASLGASMRNYGAKSEHGESGRDVVSMQQFGAAFRLGRFSETITCCSFDRLVGHVVCVEHSVPPGYHQCECVNGFLFCRPLVSFPG